MFHYLSLIPLITGASFNISFNWSDVSLGGGCNGTEPADMPIHSLHLYYISNHICVSFVLQDTLSLLWLIPRINALCLHVCLFWSGSGCLCFDSFRPFCWSHLHTHSQIKSSFCHSVLEDVSYPIKYYECHFDWIQYVPGSVRRKWTLAFP